MCSSDLERIPELLWSNPVEHQFPFRPGSLVVLRRHGSKRVSGVRRDGLGWLWRGLNLRRWRRRTGRWCRGLRRGGAGCGSQRRRAGGEQNRNEKAQAKPSSCRRMHRRTSLVAPSRPPRGCGDRRLVGSELAACSSGAVAATWCHSSASPGIARAFHTASRWQTLVLSESRKP